MNLRADNNSNSRDLREKSIRRIRQAVEQGSSFDQACSLISVENRELKEAIVAESLRTLIAEIHVRKGVPLKQLAMKLQLSMSRLLKAKEVMESEPEEAGLMGQKAGVTNRTSAK